MDESTAGQWAVIGVDTAKSQGRVADYDPLPLEHFEPLVRQVFGQAKLIGG